MPRSYVALVLSFVVASACAKLPRKLGLRKRASPPAKADDTSLSGQTTLPPEWANAPACSDPPPPRAATPFHAPPIDASVTFVAFDEIGFHALSASYRYDFGEGKLYAEGHDHCQDKDVESSRQLDVAERTALEAKLKAVKVRESDGSAPDQLVTCRVDDHTFEQRGGYGEADGTYYTYHIAKHPFADEPENEDGDLAYGKSHIGDGFEALLAAATALLAKPVTAACDAP